MIFYEKGKNNNISFNINGKDYIVSHTTVKKYNYDERDKNGIAIKEQVGKAELERLVISLVKLIYNQNKLFTENLIRGV